MDFTRKLSFLVFVLCVLISLKKQKAEPNRNGSFQEDHDRDHAVHQWLRYQTCPSAEQVIRSTVQELNENLAPLRLVFHHCFVEAGVPFYPLFTGTKDGTCSHYEAAAYELPSPRDDLSWTIESFASRAFDAREIVSLMGTIHCKLLLSHIYTFKVTYKPDPSLDTEFLDLLGSRCNHSHPSSPSSTEINLSPNDNPRMKMDCKDLNTN